MAQTTLVLALEPEQRERLRRAVAAGGLELRTVDHALFSARAPGVVATLYRSGKLVVQGSDAAAFVARYLGDAAPAARPPARAALPGPLAALDRGDLVGGDESGKGDYFGPLVVAAVALRAGDAEALHGGGVADSKTLTDARALRLGSALRARFPHALRVLDPPEYNRRHAACGNVAILLSDLYREVVEEVVRPGGVVLIDQFSKDPRRLTRAFRGLDVELHQVHRAEASMAVAAASLVAREAFLDRLRTLGEEHGVDLPKGAGPPVLAAARRFLALHPPERLGEVAKLHFRTTERVLGGGRKDP